MITNERLPPWIEEGRPLGRPSQPEGQNRPALQRPGNP
jgi:hypothetical protein